MKDPNWKIEGYNPADYNFRGAPSYEYKINLFAHMLAGYDETTWKRLSNKTKSTYRRAAATVLFNVNDFNQQMKEWDEQDRRSV